MNHPSSGTDFHIAVALARAVGRFGDACYLLEMKEHLKSELGWSDVELAQFDELITKFDLPSKHELTPRRAEMFKT